MWANWNNILIEMIQSDTMKELMGENKDERKELIEKHFQRMEAERSTEEWNGFQLKRKKKQQISTNCEKI